MKGIVFNLLEDAVTGAQGPDAWDEVLETADLEGAYTALGNYPHTELLRLIGAICSLGGSEADEVVRGFGRTAMPALALRYPEFFAPHASTKPFIESVDGVIHREVVKIYPGAKPPRIGTEDPAPDVLVLHYVSHRRLCAFAEGMIEGAADHYGERIELDHPECLKRGDERCTIVVTFAGPAQGP
jgi:hypothetical protein